MITIGKTYSLKVTDIQSFAVYLDGKELDEVLLPSKEAPEELSIGDFIDVFLYYDSNEQVVATTKIPKAQVGEFAYLEVKAITGIGNFLDMGIDRDVFLPFREQHRPLELGNSYIVYLYLDKITGRITASSKVDKFIDEAMENDFAVGQEVELVIANSSELGHKAIINKTHWGLLYSGEIFQKLSFGQNITGYIKLIREDGKIDLRLHAGDKISRDKYAQLILDYLEEHDGFAEVHDKSSPQLIADIFAISKKQFKNAIGGLYKQKAITISKEGIRLV